MASTAKTPAMKDPASPAAPGGSGGSTTRGGRPAPGRSRVFHRGSVRMLLGAALLLVGSFTPWVITPLGSIPGHAGPGLMTLSAGFIAIAGAFLPYRRVAIAHCFIAGAGTAALLLWQLTRLIQLSAATGTWGSMLPGIGMVLCAGGSVLLIGAGVLLLRTR